MPNTKSVLEAATLTRSGQRWVHNRILEAVEKAKDDKWVLTQPLPSTNDPDNVVTWAQHFNYLHECADYNIQALTEFIDQVHEVAVTEGDELTEDQEEMMWALFFDLRSSYMEIAAQVGILLYTLEDEVEL